MGERFGRHVSYANVVATLALVLAMTGGAIAATGGFTSGGALRGCVNGEGVLRLLKAGKHCRHGQQQVTWNQQGPAGTAGATGARGAEGPKGTEGPKGVSGEAANVEWARVNQEGDIVAGHGALAAGEGTGHYVVAFDRDITKCGLVATANGPANREDSMVSAVPAGTEAFIYIDAPTGVGLNVDGYTVVAYC
jgi:hypothetical protein